MIHPLKLKQTLRTEFKAGGLKSVDKGFQSVSRQCS